MAEVYKFFNSAPGDERWHYASDFADYFSSVLSAGLLLDQNQEYGLQVTYNSGLNVKVSTGKALIKGYSYENTTDLTLTHNLPETTLDRIDRIVLRLDLKNASRYIKAFVKEGVASETPVAPELQRDQYIYELSLAQVRLRANTASIEANDITDERALEDLCGIVQSLITVPTSVFQQQFDAWFNSQKANYETDIAEWQNQEKADFESWVASLHDILDGDVAANLANQITTVQQDLAAHKTDYVSHPGTGTTTNVGNAYAVTLNPAPTSYVDKMGLILTINADSTGASTINVNGLGVKPIKKANGTDVTNLKANGVYTVRYNSATGNFILQGEGGSGNATASDLLSGKTASTDAGDIVGTMPNRGTFNLGLGVSVPAGYYSGGTTATGKHWASGTATSGTTATATTGKVLANQYALSVTGLGFLPKVIKVLNGTKAETVYDGDSPYEASGVYYKLLISNSSLYNPVNWANLSVSNGSFTVPTSSSNTLLNWVAYE